MGLRNLQASKAEGFRSADSPVYQPLVRFGLHANDECGVFNHGLRGWHGYRSSSVSFVQSVVKV